MEELYELERSEAVRRAEFEYRRNEALRKAERQLSHVYDRDQQWPIYATQPVRPDSLYGVSKAFGENLGRHYYDQYGFSVICLRIGWFLPKPRDEISRWMWLSPRDCAQVTACAIETELGYGVFYAISRNSRRHWDITDTIRLQQFTEAFESLEDKDDLFIRKDTRLQTKLTDNMVGQLQWILLYDNTPAGGNVSVTGICRKDSVEIVICDSGVGVSPDALPRLFQRFYRASASRGSTNGSGLGLAICKAIVDRHGGRIAIEAQLGHGTRVSVQLPDVATVADVLRETGEQHPALSRHLPHCRVAVNREYAREHEPVREGDEIALLPPVSGG